MRPLLLPSLFAVPKPYSVKVTFFLLVEEEEAVARVHSDLERSSRFVCHGYLNLRSAVGSSVCFTFYLSWFSFFFKLEVMRGWRSQQISEKKCT